MKTYTSIKGDVPKDYKSMKLATPIAYNYDGDSSNNVTTAYAKHYERAVTGDAIRSQITLINQTAMLKLSVPYQVIK